MCSTCGCGVGEGGATILKPGEFANAGAFHLTEEHHHHGHAHEHVHSHATGSEKTIIEVEKEILGHNQLLAERNRGFFEAKKITAINLVSSPGSGKTTLLETTLDDLKDKHKVLNEYLKYTNNKSRTKRAMLKELLNDVIHDTV